MTLDGKVALITGGARGMGRVSAIALAQMGARVIIVDWEGEAGTRARDYINHITGRQAADFVYCDLSSLQAVRALADDVKARELMPDGTYRRVAAAFDALPVRSQSAFQELARDAGRARQMPLRQFTPIQRRPSTVNVS